MKGGELFCVEGVDCVGVLSDEVGGFDGVYLGCCYGLDLVGVEGVEVVGVDVGDGFGV